MTLSENCIAAGVAGIVASVLTHPVDVIKTNFMVFKSSHEPTYAGVFYKIYKESGMFGFKRGLFFRTLQMSLMSIFLLTGFEQVLGFLMSEIKFEPV